MDNQDRIRQSIADSIAVKQAVLEDAAFLQKVEMAATDLTAAFKAGNKVLFCGNGGSAGDAQHIAAELSGRFYFDRDPLPAEALHVNSSYLTAVANDYGYEQVYARMTKAMGQQGDVLVGLSTSGNSENVVRALEVAREQGMITVGFTGQGGGRMAALCHHLLDVPATNTARIQESHILLGHILCQLIESTLFDQP